MPRQNTMVRAALAFGMTLAAGLLLWQSFSRGRTVVVQEGEPYAEVELRLSTLGVPKRPPRAGDWLAAHPEPGQTFNDYIAANPPRRTATRKTIYLCLVGDFSSAQEQVLEITRAYMAVFFDSPVQVLKRIPLDDIPGKAQRRHPADGHLQLLTHHFLYERLKQDCPGDALAYVAFTATDLWTRDSDGRDWNFVFGQADLANRLGVWSLARFGDPAASPEARRRCLKLTMGTATHETGHILGLHHCVFHECNLNGSNHLEEASTTPTPLCPMCLRKLCWNLQLDPVVYLQRLADFCAKHEMTDDEKLYRRAVEILQSHRNRK
jgi:archaemetzincin